MSRRAGLQLVLFLGLVALGILVVEHLPAPQERRGGQAAGHSAPAPEPAVPVAVLEGDELVLRLGGPTPVQPALKSTSTRPATPSRPAQPAPKPSLPQHDTYVVQPGDTLSDIARRELGSAQLAGELARLNKLSDPGAIRPGQVLRLR